MNFTTLIAQTYTSLREEEGTGKSTFPAALVQQWINEGYQQILAAADWGEMQRFVEIVVPKTTTATAMLATDTTVTFTSVSGFKLGYLVGLYNSSIIIYRRITAINRTTKVVTFDRAPGFAIASGSSVLTRGIYIPQYTKINSVLMAYDGTTTEVLKMLKRKKWKQYYEYASSLPATPAMYFVKHPVLESEVSFTAAASTSTTVVYDSGTVIYENDCFNNYYIQNNTHPGREMILDCDSTAKTITLENAITSQVATDTVVVYRNNPMLILKEPYDGSCRLTIEYQAPPTEQLITTYREIPSIMSYFHYALIDYACFRAMLHDGNSAAATQFFEMYKAKLLDAYKLCERTAWFNDMVE